MLKFTDQKTLKNAKKRQNCFEKCLKKALLNGVFDPILDHFLLFFRHVVTVFDDF